MIVYYTCSYLVYGIFSLSTVWNGAMLRNVICWKSPDIQ